MLALGARAALALVLGVVGVAGSFGCFEPPAGAADGDASHDESRRRRIPAAADDPRIGAADAPIQIALFVDFSCPHSREAYERARVAVAASGGDVALVVKQAPQRRHLLAAAAARAALAAHRQGRFDDMARALFAAPSAFDRPALVAHARTLGLEVSRFERDVDGAAVAAQVERDRALARSLGLTVTPWWFVNGVGFKGRLDDARLADILAAEREYVGDLVAGGVSRAEVHAHLMARAARPAEARSPESPLDLARRYAVPVEEDDLRFGPVDAPVTVIVFGGVECPSTRKLWRALDRVRARHRDAVRVVVKHDPLPRHRHAVDAHLAVVAARRFGRDAALFERLIRGDGLSGRAELLVEAARVGVDPTKLEAAMADPEVIDAVRGDRHLAARFGVAGTPTTFVNGRPVIGVVHPDHLGELVEQERQAPTGAAMAGALTEVSPPRRPVAALELAPAIDVAIAPDDPARGPVDAPVTVIAYMDFECPHSATAAAALDRLRARHGDRVRTVFKHLPLAMHDHARNAAAAALAAQQQGRFWEMHDWLFAHQSSLDRASIEAALPSLGIDRERFARDFDDAAITDRKILASEAEGKALGFSGTPTLVIDGHVVPGLVPDELLDELVASARAW